MATQKMPEFLEIGESGSGSVDDSSEGNRSREFTVKYLIANLNGYDAAEERVMKLAPLLRRGHRRGRIGLEPVGGQFYVASVQYRNESVVVREAMRFAGWEWETNEKSEHITQFANDGEDPLRWVIAHSKDTTPSGIRPGDAGIPNFKGAIGVQEDQVRGLDKPVSVFNWTETWICPASWITGKRPESSVTETVNGQPKKISLSTEPLETLAAKYPFHTNEYAFRGKPPGCVLLTGIRTSRMNLGGSSATLTFSFSYNPLKENFLVGDVKVEKKDGWDYLDIYYETDHDTQDIVKTPKWVFVGRVFDRVDFRNLGIPDTIPRWYLDKDMPGHVFDTPYGS